MFKSLESSASQRRTPHSLALSVVAALAVGPSLHATSAALNQLPALTLSALASTTVDAPSCIVKQVGYYIEAYGCNCEWDCWTDNYTDYTIEPLGIPNRWWDFYANAGGCDKWGDPVSVISGQLVLTNNTFEVRIGENYGGRLWGQFTVELDRPHLMGTTLLEAGSHTFDFTEEATVTTFLRAYRADIVSDGVVNNADLAEILDNWGPCDPWRNPADTNYDGAVDGFDLIEVLSAWGSTG